MASVASVVTSSAHGGGGLASTAPSEPPRMRRRTSKASGVTGRPRRHWRQRPLEHVERDEVDRVGRLTTGRAAGEERAGAFEDERLHEERRRDESWARAGSATSQRADEHLVEPRVRMALLGELVGDLDERERLGHPVEVLANAAEVVEHLGLVDDVEVAPALPQQERGGG